MGRIVGTATCKGLKSDGSPCLERVAVDESAGGNLTCKCQFCKFSTYAPPGSPCARGLRATMVPVEDTEAPPAKPPAAAPTPEKKPARTPFSLGDLT